MVILGISSHGLRRLRYQHYKPTNICEDSNVLWISNLLDSSPMMQWPFFISLEWLAGVWADSFMPGLLLYPAHLTWNSSADSMIHASLDLWTIFIRDLQAKALARSCPRGWSDSGRRRSCDMHMDTNLWILAISHSEYRAVSISNMCEQLQACSCLMSQTKWINWDSLEKHPRR